MPTTTNWEIVFPNNTTAPNVPADLEAQAQSVEAAFNDVALAPLIICAKNAQTLTTAGTHYDVTWHTEVHSQKITHTLGDSTFIVEEAGIYNVNALIAFDTANATGTVVVAVNGVIDPRTLIDEASSPTAYAKVRLSHYLKLNEGDGVKVIAYSSINSTPISNQSSFHMAKIAGF